MCESSLRVIHNNVILLQPAVYPYLHRLIYQQSPHHLLLVCHCVCNLSANVIPCGVIMLCIAIANLKFNDALILFNCVYIHVDVAAHLPPMVKYVTMSSNEEADNSSNSRKQN